MATQRHVLNPGGAGPGLPCTSHPLVRVRRVRIHRWLKPLAGGPQALHSRGPSGPTPRLSDAQLATIEQALLEALGHGHAQVGEDDAGVGEAEFGVVDQVAGMLAPGSDPLPTREDQREKVLYLLQVVSRRTSGT